MDVQAEGRKRSIIGKGKGFLKKIRADCSSKKLDSKSRGTREARIRR